MSWAIEIVILVFLLKVLLILQRYTERLILYKPTLNDGSMNLVKVNTALNCIEQCQKWFLIAQLCQCMHVTTHVQLSSL